MCAQRLISDWLKILRIAGELGASDIEGEAVRSMNSAGVLEEHECVRLACALQAEAERKRAALTQPWTRVRQALSTTGDQQLQHDTEFAWYRQRSGEGAVLEELQRLSLMLSQLRAIVTSHEPKTP